jgi:TetR/AcrR family transcriptional regulator
MKRAKPRNAELTKSQILSAAEFEFSSKGFAGARMDGIAKRARINKRMIYIYWGNKQTIYREILRRRVLEFSHLLTGTPGNPGDKLVHYFEMTANNIDYVRLVQWEALSRPRNLVAEEERRAAFAANVAAMLADQKRGLITSAAGAEELQLAFMALAAYPFNFPQLTWLVTGLQPEDSRFQQRWAQLLTAMADHLKPAAQTDRRQARRRLKTAAT